MAVYKIKAEKWVAASQKRMTGHFVLQGWWDNMNHTVPPTQKSPSAVVMPCIPNSLVIGIKKRLWKAGENRISQVAKCHPPQLWFNTDVSDTDTVIIIMRSASGKLLDAKSAITSPLDSQEQLECSLIFWLLHVLTCEPCWRVAAA